MICCLSNGGAQERAIDSVRLQQLVYRIEASEEAGLADSIVFYYQEKAALHRQGDDLAGWLNTYWDLHANFYDQPDTALVWLAAAQEGQWRRPQNKEEWEALLWIYVNRGYHAFRLGDVTASIAAYEEADAVYRRERIDDFYIVEYVYKPLGSYYTMLGDNERARSVYERAFEVAAPDERAGLYNNYGITYWNEGNNEAAIAAYEKGLRLASLPSGQRGLLQTSLARSYLETGRLDKAAAFSQAAIRNLMAADPGDAATKARYLSSAYLQLGAVRRQQGRLSESRNLLDKALTKAEAAFGTREHRYSAKIFIEMGALFRQSKNWEEAAIAYNRALSCVLPAFNPVALRDHPDPSTFHEENAIFEALEGKAAALKARYAATGDIGDLESALNCHQLAFRAEDGLWNVLQNESARLQLQAYRRHRTGAAIDIAHQLYQETGQEDYLAQAFVIAERSRASLLGEAIRENLFRQELEAGDTLLSREAELQRLYSFYDREFQLAGSAEARKQFLILKNEVSRLLASVRSRIEKRYPKLRQLTHQDQFSFSALRQVVDDRPATVLIEYMATEEFIYAFRLQAGKAPELFRLDYNLEKQALLDAFLKQLSSRQALSNERTVWLERSAALYRWLLEPLLPPAGSELLILPDGPLNFLPFETLVTRPAETGWNKASFLVRQYPVTYGYSAAILLGLRKHSSSSGKDLLAAAPVFADGQRGLSPLSYSESEVQSLVLGRSERLLGEEATRENFAAAAGKFRVLHLSTHAGADSAGRPPRIEFIDGPLYLPEIYALDLQADLVTLSACETGLGHFQAGEGVMSLSRGFVYAGAASLVASLWTVNERSTATLFRFFYEGIRRGDSRGKALAEAKMAYLNDPEISSFLKSPYYWAGFVYYGNNEPVTLAGGGWNWTWFLAGLLILVGVGGWWARPKGE